MDLPAKMRILGFARGRDIDVEHDIDLVRLVVPALTVVGDVDLDNDGVPGGVEVLAGSRVADLEGLGLVEVLHHTECCVIIADGCAMGGWDVLQCVDSIADVGYSELIGLKGAPGFGFGHDTSRG